MVDTQHHARARGKRAHTPLVEALPSLPAPPAKHRKMHESARGGARSGGGSAAAAAAKIAGIEVARMEGGAAEGEGVKASAVKVEEYDRSYACSICWEPVRGNTAVLRCSQCSSKKDEAKKEARYGKERRNSLDHSDILMVMDV